MFMFLKQLIMHLTKATEGSIHFNNKDLTKLSRSELREQRKDIQMIFQDQLGLNDKKETDYFQSVS